MNSKGFTLIEALAVIVLLGIVLSIGGYSVANYLNKSKTDALDIFKKNIKSGMINYYNECSYISDDLCFKKMENGSFELDDNGEKISIINISELVTTIGDLVEYGFLQNQASEENESSLTIKNPVDDTDLTNCKVSIIYNKFEQEFSDVTYDENTCGSLGN